MVNRRWTDRPVRERIANLRRSDVEIELDQCWDLLRQRRARREVGQDPGQARVRPVEVVENYVQ